MVFVNGRKYWVSREEWRRRRYPTEAEIHAKELAKEKERNSPTIMGLTEDYNT